MRTGPRQKPQRKADGTPNAAAYQTDRISWMRGLPLRFTTEDELLKKFKYLVNRRGTWPVPDSYYSNNY